MERQKSHVKERKTPDRGLVKATVTGHNLATFLGHISDELRRLPDRTLVSVVKDQGPRGIISAVGLAATAVGRQVESLVMIDDLGDGHVGAFNGEFPAKIC